jgi:peptidyl-prolyl cis-trans isomerase A (cyclophilin A)
MVVLETSLGTIKLELDAEKAPVTVANFLRYVDEKHYDGTIFHRVIPGFMVQCGGFTADMKQKPTGEPIDNEAKNGLKNKKYTIAMARTSQVNSATSQFFINTADNAFLDNGARDYGYAVFGHVAEGTDVVDRIEKSPTKTVAGMENVPAKAITINTARRAEAPAK